MCSGVARCNIMSLGRGVERRGGVDVEDGRRYAGRRVADALALWRPTGSIPFELRHFQFPKLLKIELHSKTYE
jgi:hypothetical protein